MWRVPVNNASTGERAKFIAQIQFRERVMENCACHAMRVALCVNAESNEFNLGFKPVLIVLVSTADPTTNRDLQSGVQGDGL